MSSYKIGTPPYSETEIKVYRAISAKWPRRSVLNAKIREMLGVSMNSGIEFDKRRGLIQAVKTVCWESPYGRRMAANPKGKRLSGIQVPEEMHLVSLVIRLPELRDLTDKPEECARWRIENFGPNNTTKTIPDALAEGGTAKQGQNLAEGADMSKDIEIAGDEAIQEFDDQKSQEAVTPPQKPYFDPVLDCVKGA